MKGATGLHIKRKMSSLKYTLDKLLSFFAHSAVDFMALGSYHTKGYVSFFHGKNTAISILTDELEPSEAHRFRTEPTIKFANGNYVMLQINSRELSAGVTTVLYTKLLNIYTYCSISLSNSD